MNKRFIGLLQGARPFYLAAALALGLRLLLISPYVVEGHSMEPSLADGTILIGERISPRLGLHPGDTVVIDGPFPMIGEAELIKRVVAVGPAVLEVRDGAVWVDGQRLSEAYLPSNSQTLPLTSESRWEIPAGSVFLLGDNRGNSTDSRFFGPIETTRIPARLLLTLPTP